MSDSQDRNPRFTPAAGYHFLTPFYDAGVAITTRERRWRGRLVELMAPAPDDIILDVGSGTGNLAAAIARRGGGARYLGIDPDDAATRIAREKTARLLPQPDFRVGFFTAASIASWPMPTKVTICLVLHQVGLAEKARLLREAWLCLAPGGQLYIADYGEQRSRLMRILFRLTIQQLDGVADTQPNADGCLPALIGEAGFETLCEEPALKTVTGAISIMSARKPMA